MIGNSSLVETPLYVLKYFKETKNDKILFCMLPFLFYSDTVQVHVV